MTIDWTKQVEMKVSGTWHPCTVAVGVERSLSMEKFLMRKLNADWPLLCNLPGQGTNRRTKLKKP